MFNKVLPPETLTRSLEHPALVFKAHSGMCEAAQSGRCQCVFPYFTGDVEIGLLERNGGLEVEVVQARGLTMKSGSKTAPGLLPRTHKYSQSSSYNPEWRM